MAEWNSTQYGLTQGVPASKVPVYDWGARVRMRFADFPGATGLAQNDTVILFPLLKGERAIKFMIWVDTDQAASVTIDIGDSSTEARFVAALDISTGAASYHDKLSLNTDVQTSDTLVKMKYEGANPTDVAAIRVAMLYAID